MIPRSVYERIRYLRGAAYGTGFLIEIDERQYLVTAAHLIDADAAAIDMLIGGRLEPFGVRGCRVARGDVDIAVLALDRWLPVAEAVPLAPSSATVVSQDVYFVGFPYQMWGRAPQAMGEHPVPFVAKGVLSSGFAEGTLEAFISGTNSPGFSGAPLLFQHQTLHQIMIAGVVAKYKLAYEDVVDKLNGRKAQLEVAYNTGFMVVYGIEHALNLARSLAIGPTEDGGSTSASTGNTRHPLDANSSQGQ
jgi:hypothetical protein